MHFWPWNDKSLMIALTKILEMGHLMVIAGFPVSKKSTTTNLPKRSDSYEKSETILRSVSKMHLKGMCSFCEKNCGLFFLLTLQKDPSSIIGGVGAGAQALSMRGSHNPLSDTSDRVWTPF